MFGSKATAMMALASLGMVAATTINIDNRGLPAGGTGSPQCINTCVVTVRDFYSCESGTASFVGQCDNRDGYVERPVDGCDGYTITWDVRGEDGAGFVNVWQTSTSYTQGFEVFSCPGADNLDTPLPGAGQQCAFGGSCDVA